MNCLTDKSYGIMDVETPPIINIDGAMHRKELLPMQSHDTTFTLSHKIALSPSPSQINFLSRCAGTARFAYNWFLAENGREYQAHKDDPSHPKPSWGALDKRLNAIKAVEFPWMYEVPSCIPQQSQRHLARGFSNFFAGRARFPRFKRKGRHDAFTLSNKSFKIVGRYLVIGKRARIKMRLPLRFVGKVMSCTVSRIAQRWYASFQVQLDDLSFLPTHENQGVVGVDLGVKALATLSSGEVVDGPKPLKSGLKRIRRLARTVSRRQRGSANRRKAADRLARVHARVANVRREYLHVLTDGLTRRYNVVGIEDLNVSGMTRSASGTVEKPGRNVKAKSGLNRAIADMGFGEFRRQLEYKAEMRGVEVVTAHRFYPSSKTCSDCGLVNGGLTLSERSWACECGATHDRDLNAAKNLEIMAATVAVTACGGSVRLASGQRFPLKQEPSRIAEPAVA